MSPYDFRQVLFYLEFMGVNDLRGMAYLDLRGMAGRIYVGDYMY